MEVIDVSGKRFGRLTVLERAGSTKDGKATWNCVCDCGANVVEVGKLLRNGHVRSCGCLVTDTVAERNTKHGSSKRGNVERLYKVWLSMHTRTMNPACRHYQYYGQKGVSICDEWRNDYSAFKTWAISNGYDPCAPRGRCTIDRIDGNGAYSPENCRLVDMHIQNKNKSYTKKQGDTAWN